jgi:hypothetical protein
VTSGLVNEAALGTTSADLAGPSPKRSQLECFKSALANRKAPVIGKGKFARVHEFVSDQDGGNIACKVPKVSKVLVREITLPSA